MFGLADYICPCLLSGIQEWPDGSSYRGRFVSDVRHGYGEHSWPTGEASILSASLGQYSFFTYINMSKLTFYNDFCDSVIGILYSLFSNIFSVI